MDLTAIALQGLQQAGAQLDQAANRIANFGASSPDGANVDVVDISAEMVALMSAKNAFAANLKTIQTAQEIQQSTINIMA